MTATLVDHLLFMLIAGGLPVVSVLRSNLGETDGTEAADADAPALDRMKTYLVTGCIMVVGFLMIAGGWYGMARPFAALGLGVEAEPWFAECATLCGLMALAALALPVLARRSARLDEWLGGCAREAVDGPVAEVLPRTPREAFAFGGLNVVASLFEETIFRGYLLWYLAQVLPPLVALPLAAALFGLCHAYQGVAGILKTGALGLALSLLYLGSGSLWLGIAAHAFINIYTAWLAWRYVFAVERIGAEAARARTIQK